MEDYPRNIAGRAGHFSAHHWKRAFFGWLLFVAVFVALGQLAGTVKQTQADAASGDSGAGERILAKADFPTPATENVLVQSKALTVQDPAFRAGVQDVVRAVSGVPVVYGVRSPLAPGSQLVSQDGHSALVQFHLKGRLDDGPKEVGPVLSAVAGVKAQHRDLTIGEFGFASATKALNKTVGQDFQRAEFSTLPVTLIILLIAFGAAVAAGLPVLLAFSGFLGTLGLHSLVSHLLPAADATQSVILLIGMAVGVDYSLFYIRREREERSRGRGLDRALDTAAGTSGQAILISGLTVLIAMAGMLLSGSKIFASIGVGAMLMVAVAVAGSLTVLPATLHKLGDRVNKGRLPGLARLQSRQGESRVWGFIIRRTLAHPWLSLLGSVAVLLALAYPALGMHTQLSSFTDLPRSIPIVATYDRIQAAFPGTQTPAQVVVSAPDVRTAPVQQAIKRMEALATQSGQMSPPYVVRVNPRHTVAEVAVPLHGNGENKVAQRALQTLRQSIIPQAFRGTGAEVHVTGETAGTTDFNQTMKANAPWVFAFVLSLVFVLLMMAFRSIVIAFKSVILNLLSVGAAYGVLVLVFQHRWAEGLLSFRSNGAIVSWLPMFLFVLLFALSMDYHVFILSRVKELVDRGLLTEEAVTQGITKTASTVTAAALVMVAVFAIFATLRTLDIKQLGVGLAVAVLLDATLVRGVLLPAAMKILGEWNWYLPRWLEWLPRLSPEGEHGHSEQFAAPERPSAPSPS